MRSFLTKTLVVAMVCALPVIAKAARVVTGETTSILDFTNETGYAVCEISAETASRLVRVDAATSFASLSGRADLDDLTLSIGSIAASTNASGGATWMASDGSRWVEMTGGTPAINTDYVVRTEIDLSDKTLRHSVKSSGAGEFSPLSYGTTNWLSFVTSPSSLSGITAMGDFTNIVLKAEIEVSDTFEISGGGNIVIDLQNDSVTSALAAIGITTSVATALNGTGANQLPNWQNYYFGIHTNSVVKPFTAPVQNEEADKLTFSLGGVNVPSGIGATVKYGVQQADSPAGLDAAGEPAFWSGPDSPITLDAPDGVKYYRVKICIETP